MRHTAPDLTSGRLLPVVATLLCFCSLSTERGQQFYYTSFQQPPSPPQYEDFFQPRPSDSYSPYRQSPFPASSSAPHSFSSFQQGSQLYQQRAPSFLDQITLNPGSFSRDQRLLNAYPSDLNQPPSTPLAPQVYSSDPPTALAYPSHRPASQNFQSVPDDLGLSTFVDQNLEFDERPTENSKSVPKPREDRRGDSPLRRKPGTRPQAGSRNNMLSPQKTRGQSTIEIIKNAPREDHTGPQPQYHSLGSPRTRGRFSPTTKAPVKVRQFHIRTSKVPFTPRRLQRPKSTSETAEFDEPDGLDGPNPPVEVSIHPKYSFDPSGFEESVQPEDSYEDFRSQKLSVPDVHIVPEHNSDSLMPSGSDATNERPQEQLLNNSTLTADSIEVTTVLQEDTTDPIADYKVTTDTDEVTTTLHEEPTTVMKVEMPEQRVRDNGNNSSTFEVLTMNPRHTLVEEDNFRGFVDSILIDATDFPHVSTIPEDVVTEDVPSEVTLKGLNSSIEPSTQKPLDISMVTKAPVVSTVRNQDTKLLDISVATTLGSKPLGVSVVTTRSVVNGTTYAVPSVTPPILEQLATPVPAKVQPELTHPTESWVVVASVQTSRSVSGARFLPSSAVKQEERPKSLSGKTVPSSKPSFSTESIIDKYRVESELSSGILTWGFRPEGKKLQLKVLTDMTDTNTTTPASTTTYKSPVFIRKFSPHSGRTTPRPNKLAALFDSIPMDDLSRLLPPGFKQRVPTSRRTTTASPKHIDPADHPQGDEPAKPNSTSARLSGLGSAKNKIKVDDNGPVEKPPKKLDDLLSKMNFDDVGTFLPPRFKSQAIEPSTMTAKPAGVEGLLRKARPVDVSAFLPPGFKLTTEEPSSMTAKPIGVESLLSKARPVDVSAFLPPGFKLTTEGPSLTTAKPIGVESLLSKGRPVDISAFLPPGFKLKTEETSSTTAKPIGVDSLLSKARPVDVSAFLPPGFKLSSTTEKSGSESHRGKIEFRDDSAVLPPGSANENSTNSKADVMRVKFPTRAGVTRKPLQPTHKPVQGPPVQKPKISTGWPTRATTEFTGWPTPSTTPIPLEKLLEMAQRATTSSTSSTSSSTTSTTTTSTTTTTTTTPRPTTPGLCTDYCDLAGTVKLVGGVTWVPELLDHNTEEWQHLATDVQRQLEITYHKSDSLGRWFRKVRIDSFSDSASVDAVGPGQGGNSVLVDYFVELTDIGRRVDTQEIKQLFHNSLSADPADSVVSSQLQLGSFTVDPKFTDFIVLAKQMTPTVGYADEDVFLPQWAIAGIVIGLASLLFVIIFGVTVLVNRKKNNKKKSPTPLTEDMLNELNKNHMGGLDNYAADDLYNMDDVWNDKPAVKRSSGSLQENSMSNLYDSWRSEWNGYYYNAYYGNGNAGSSTSGYSRRRSDYDTNF